jgi:curved DNA-binding protein
MDPYSILGVNRGATDKEIKQAYRRAASKHHPDKGGDEAEFKRVQEAYEAITNPQPQPQSFGGGFSGTDFEEMIRQAMNQNAYAQADDRADFFRRARQQARRNPDAVVDIQITLASAYTGTDFLLEAGPIKEMLQLQPGIRDKTKLRVPGKGHSRFPDVKPGDLIVRVNVVCPQNIQIQNDDLYQVVNINALQAMVGCDKEIPHVSGKTLKIKIPAGTQAGTKLRLGGWGMPNPVNGKKGHLYAIMGIEVPTITNPEHIDKIREIMKEANL